MDNNNLCDLLARYQAEMVDVCRSLGCEPNVSIGNPEYYGDMALEAIENLQAEAKRNA